jgi:hypothetical protein
MNLKVIVGMILFFFGLGAGVIEWLRSGLATPYPMIGLAATTIGLYLIIDGLRKRQPRVVSKEEVAIGALLAAVVGGTLLASELKKKVDSAGVPKEEVEKALAQLELLRAQGKVTPEKYAELKAILESARRRV